MCGHGLQHSTPAGHRTWHITPTMVWELQQGATHYLPEAFEADGFIHCTDDVLELIAVGNRYYQSDTRAYIAIEIDCDQIGAPIVYEDPGHIFPHIYGPLESGAVIRILALIRDQDGTFLDLQRSKPPGNRWFFLRRW